jgi:putative tryptophan/tyrosine transport system substrate-binding protein
VQRKTVCLLSIWLLLTCAQPALAQKVHRVDALVSEDFFVSVFEGFKARMAEMGYVERRSIQYSLRNANGDQKLLQKLALELVQDKPDLIVTAPATATLAVTKANEVSRIPLVFLGASNPLEFVKSYASSGNNVTGISTAALDLTGKRLELLKELAPWVERLASINNPDGVNYKDNLLAVRQATKKFGLELWEINVANKKEIEQAISTITHKAVDAVFLPPDRVITGNMDVFVTQCIREKLPLIPPPGAISLGGLATYGHDYSGLGRQGAILVDRILRGAKPSDLPIEQPYRLKLVVNVKTAKAIGLKIPKEILLRADEVIE